ncbi:MAG: hypothetical protein M3O91_05210 [Chloroflexota bacterium]|nr:hypothetical protein [Chloroflexota bacterium]
MPRGASRRWEVIVADDEPEQRPAPRRLTALEVKDQHRVLHDLDPSELAAIALLAEGELLDRYGEYLDLRDPARANFLAEGSEVVRRGQRIVARRGLEPQVWQALVRACGEVTGFRRRRRTA